MKDEKRCECIHDALGYLEDELIEEVDTLRSGTTLQKQEDGIRPMFAKRKWIAIAASIALIFIAGNLWNSTIGNHSAPDMESVPEKELSDGCENPNNALDEAIDKEDVEDTEDTELEE